MLGDHGERGQQRQRIERRHRSAMLERVERHVQHGQMVGHEEGVEAAALQRLRESLQVREIEIRIRKRSRVEPRGGVDTDRPHERTEAQLSLASHATSPADRWLASLGILEMMQSSRLDDIINRMLSHKSKYALEALLV